MLQDSFATAQQDMQARALVEARVDADRMLLATQSALDADGDLLSSEDRTLIDQSMTALRQAHRSTDAAVVEAATKALAHVTEGFAAARMNAGIARALSGRKVESL
jgi:molecular chaperone HscA